MISDRADTLYLCYRIDLDAGATTNNEVFEAVSSLQLLIDASYLLHIMTFSLKGNDNHRWVNRKIDGASSFMGATIVCTYRRHFLA